MPSAVRGSNSKGIATIGALTSSRVSHLMFGRFPRFSSLLNNLPSVRSPILTYDETWTADEYEPGD